MTADKIFIDANSLLADSLRLGMQVIDSGFAPRLQVGGAPFGDEILRVISRR